ncbi:E3 ubiquitin-protein ligase ATL41 [Glycine soja]
MKIMDVFDNDHDHDEPFVRYHSNVNRTILYVSMVSFITVLFLVFALYLYARCVLRGRSRNRAAIRRLTIAALHVSDLDAAAAAHRHAEPPNAGLDPAIIASLPTFTSRTKVLENGGDGGGGGATVVECAVCLSALEGEEKAKLLPNCNHFFHVDCIDKWLGSHSTCPICRAEVKPQLQPQHREGPVGLSLHSARTLLSRVDGDDDNNNNDNESSKINDSNSRLSSFRRILSRQRSSRRVQPSGHDDEDGGVDQDLERHDEHRRESTSLQKPEKWPNERVSHSILEDSLYSQKSKTGSFDRDYLTVCYKTSSFDQDFNGYRTGLIEAIWVDDPSKLVFWVDDPAWVGDPEEVDDFLMVGSGRASMELIASNKRSCSLVRVLICPSSSSVDDSWSSCFFLRGFSISLLVDGMLEVVSNPWRFTVGNWLCDSDLVSPTGIERVLIEKDLLAESYSDLEASILDEKEFLLLIPFRSYLA